MIYASVDGTTFEAIDLVTDQTSYQATGLVPGAMFTFQVTAENTGDVESDATDSASATTLLASPMDLSATVSHSDEVDLSWADQSFGTAADDCSHLDRCGKFHATDEVAAGVNEYAAVGLSPDQTYAFMVMADYAIGQRRGHKPDRGDGDLIRACAIGPGRSMKGMFTGSMCRPRRVMSFRRRS